MLCTIPVTWKNGNVANPRAMADVAIKKRPRSTRLIGFHSYALSLFLSQRLNGNAFLLQRFIQPLGKSHRLLIVAMQADGVGFNRHVRPLQ